MELFILREKDTASRLIRLNASRFGKIAEISRARDKNEAARANREFRNDRGYISLESHRYKSRLGFRSPWPPVYSARYANISANNSRGNVHYRVASLKRVEKNPFPSFVRAYSSRHADARARNRQKIDRCVFRYTHMYANTCTFALIQSHQSRACVHFHRRARRNCKVAYMQGVKLGSRRFDPRPRIEISIRCNSSEFQQRQGSLVVRVPPCMLGLFGQHRRPSIRSVAPSTCLLVKPASINELRRPFYCTVNSAILVRQTKIPRRFKQTFRIPRY